MTESEFPDQPEFDDPGLQSSDALASAEDQLWIAGLLGSLKAQDAPMPDVVTHRIDDALRSQAASSGHQESRLSPNSRRGRRWLAVAAAAAVLIGGTAIYRQASTPQQSGAAVASDNFSAQASEAAPIVPGSAISDSTATANTRVIDGSAVAASKDTIATAIGAALANLNQSASGAAAQGTGTAQGTGAAVVPAPISPSSEAAIVSSTAGSPWADCLVKVDGGSAGGLTAVVTGITYQGRTADVLVRTVDANHLDIWVIAIGCTGAKTDLLDHEVIVV